MNDGSAPVGHVVTLVEQTRNGYPSAWKIVTEDGQDLYAKYRRGTLSLFTRTGQHLDPYPVVRMQIGQDWDGDLSTADMMKYLELKLVAGKGR